MFDYSGLGFSDFLSQIIYEISITTDYDMLMFLETYKYYTREELVTYLNQTQTQKFLAVSEINSDKRFKNVEMKYNVFVSVNNDMTAYVLYDGTKPIQFENIELDVSFNSFTPIMIALTPRNFEELQGKIDIEYNPTLLLKRILIDAVDKNATDIHFEVNHVKNSVEYPILYRINGELLNQNLFNINQNLNKSIISVLIEKKTSSNSLDLLESAGVVASAPNLLGDAIELRISANRVVDGYHFVIRIQRKTTVSLHICELGFHTEVLNALYDAARKQSGVTLITGAIRTGKNTTAFAMANEILTKPVKIVSYESPIEVLMPFPQLDYKESPEMLLDAIRLAKKQDVNVAFINEIPTKEVAFALQDLVNSSIHVITTMHMDRIWHLPYKLKEYYGDNYKDVISQINVVFNQKMFSKACPMCREKIIVSSVKNDKYRKILEEHGVTSLWRNTGCETCSNTGNVLGSNQPFVEFVVFTDELITNLLKCEKPSDMEIILRQSMKLNSLERYMTEAIAQGELSVDALNSIV